MSALTERVIIIGNSGCGKSTLAHRMGSVLAIPITDLDTLHWTGGGYKEKRDEHEARQLVIDAGAAPRWIVEGVFGWLVEAVIERATTLIWLDLSVAECHQMLVARGRQNGETEATFADLLAWCDGYSTRTTSSSFEGHLRIFNAFSATKRRLQSRDEIEGFIRAIG